MTTRVGAFVLALLLAATGACARAAEPVFAKVDPDQRMTFPRDHGAHPDYRSEWWYVTGWLHTADGDDVGFQVTFFRARTSTDDANPSRFAPKQLLFAHAAIADRRIGRLVHAQRIAREGFGDAAASTADADVRLGDWRFRRVPDAGGTPGATDRPLHFTTRVDGGTFAIDLDLVAAGPPLEQGADAARPGYSQKGPSPRDASRYYSVPQVTVTGTIVRPAADGKAASRRPTAVTGTAWIDREWSSAYLDAQAVGWDWAGIDLDDGGALMAFRMRDHRGAKLWAGGARRFPDGRVERYGPDDIDFLPLRTWTSPASGATWPVSQAIEIGRRFASTADAGAAHVTRDTIALDPLMDNQELDSRDSTGTIYWEGAVRAHRDGTRGAPVGRGYLELTGYWRRMRF